MADGGNSQSMMIGGLIVVIVLLIGGFAFYTSTANDADIEIDLPKIKLDK